MQELRERLFPIALIFGCLAAWVIAILGDLEVLSVRLPAGALWAWLAVQVLCMACYALSRRRPILARVGYIVGFGAILLALAQSGTVPGIVLLFPLLTVWSVLLIGRSISLLLIGVLIAILGLTPATTPALLLTLLSWAAGCFITFTLGQVLEISREYQRYAVRQMNEARDHRGHLAQLTKALREAKLDLERANTQLNHLQSVTEDARRAKAQFAANVSHEIRTPINLIVGFSEMLLQAQNANTQTHPDSFWTSVQTIMRNSKHLQALINDVLDMSQLDAGQMALLREEVDPRQIILDTAGLLGEAVERKGLHLVVDLPPALPRLALDRIRIRQVILNLLGNAIRFTDKGTITLSARIVADQLSIRVRDTGIGIPPGELDRVFEEFHQLDSSMSRRYGGSGLGLTLSKRFVELHDGRLRVESDGIPGHGSTFIIDLPLQVQPHSGDYPINHAPYQLGGRYFLVHDPDTAVRTLFERHTARHRPVTTTDLAELLRLAATIHPTAIVVDDDAPISEIEAALSESQNPIPIIACTMPSGKRAIERYGVADYLLKPVTAEALIGAIERLPTPPNSIMIVDDDREIVRLYTQILEARGYRPRKAYNGREALEFMNRRPPDAVILDVLMPGMTGFEVIAAMQAAPNLATIPIIMASAAGASEAIETRIPGLLHVHKPTGFQPLELVGCVEALIERLSPATLPIAR
jgi:signal transduction histidine kinase/CheY-like chemotaxis protein